MADNDKADAECSPNPKEVQGEEAANVSEAEAVTIPLSKDREEVVDDDELDALLNDALNDFGKVPPPTSHTQSKTRNANTGNLESRLGPGSSGSDDMSKDWSEEFIQEATAQFEKKMREYVSQGQGQAGVSPNPGSNDTLHHVIDVATKAALKSSTDDPGLRINMSEAIKDLAANPDFLQNPMAFNDQDLSKILENFGIDGDDDKEMQGLLPFMSTMMQKLLSKELLQPVLGDIVDRYPSWLSRNKETLSNADYEKYSTQYENMRKICEEYAKEKDSDTEEIKQKRFDFISDLMLKVQSSGPPPQELTGDMENGAGAFGGFDPSQAAGGQCSVM